MTTEKFLFNLDDEIDEYIRNARRLNLDIDLVTNYTRSILNTKIGDIKMIVHLLEIERYTITRVDNSNNVYGMLL